MTTDIPDPDQTLRQKYFLVSRRGMVIFVLLALVMYVLMVFVVAWGNQPIYSKSPYKWDKKRLEVCAKNKDVPNIDESKVSVGFDGFGFKPVTGYAPASLFDTNPECIGYGMRRGLYGGSTGSFRTIYVNKNNEVVAEITVLYTDNKDE